MSVRNVLVGAALLFGLATGSANAATFGYMIGDDDGYGEGTPDNGNVITMANCCVDQRSPAEQAATDGSEQTDINSALFNPVSTTTSFIFSLSGVLNSATLTLDIGGLQVDDFGETLDRKSVV